VHIVTITVLKYKGREMIPKVVALDERQPKKRLQSVKIPVLCEALRYIVTGLRQDIQVILDSGITAACLARTLGVHPVTLFRWRAGKYNPKEDLVFITIKLWAEEIKKEQTER
jgi:DNA-binding XRE family transcriptional regulator